MTGIILAGGSGTRMERKDKALLTLNGKTFIQRKSHLLGSVCRSIIIVSAQGTDYPGIPARIVHDEKPGYGPLMGLYTGLKASTDEINLITTVDSPFFCSGLAEYLFRHIGSFDAVVPKWNGFIEPLFAVYRKTCIPYIFRQYERRKIVSFYPFITISFIPESRIRSFDPEGLSFININTMEEYNRINESSLVTDRQDT